MTEYLTATILHECCGCPLPEVKFSWINIHTNFEHCNIVNVFKLMKQNSEILDTHSCCVMAAILVIAS